MTRIIGMEFCNADDEDASITITFAGNDLLFTIHSDGCQHIVGVSSEDFLTMLRLIKPEWLAPESNKTQE